MGKIWLLKQICLEALGLLLAAVIAGLISNAIIAKGVAITSIRPAPHYTNELGLESVQPLPKIRILQDQAESAFFTEGLEGRKLTVKAGEPVIFSTSEIQQLRKTGRALLIDARTDKQYARGHIPESINLPVETIWENMESLEKLPIDKWLVTYCEGPTCDSGERLAYELIAYGFQRVAVYHKGITGWRNAGFRLQKESGLAGRKP